MIFKLVIVVLAFAVSVLGSVGFAAANALHSGRQLEGLSLLVALGALAIDVIVWATGVLPAERVVDQRDDYPSSANARAEAEAALDIGVRALARRGFVVEFFASAFGELALAASLSAAFASHWVFDRTLCDQMAQGITFGARGRHAGSDIRFGSWIGPDGVPSRVRRRRAFADTAGPRRSGPYSSHDCAPLIERYRSTLPPGGSLLCLATSFSSGPCESRHPNVTTVANHAKNASHANAPAIGIRNGTARAPARLCVATEYIPSGNTALQFACT